MGEGFQAHLADLGPMPADPEEGTEVALDPAEDRLDLTPLAVPLAITTRLHQPTIATGRRRGTWPTVQRRNDRTNVADLTVFVRR